MHGFLEFTIQNQCKYFCQSILFHEKVSSEHIFYKPVIDCTYESSFTKKKIVVFPEPCMVLFMNCLVDHDVSNDVT